MFVLGNILFAVARVLDTLLTLYFWVVIISALLTWVRPDPYNPVVRTLNALTEPVLYRIRKWLPFTYILSLIHIYADSGHAHGPGCRNR